MSSVRVNGFHYSWSSIGFKEAANDIDYLSEVSFTVTREIGKPRGAGNHKYGRTRGDADYTGQLAWFAEQFYEARATKDAFGDEVFNLHLSVQEAGFSLITFELEACLFLEGAHEWTRGPDILMVTTPIDIMDVRVNGKKWFGGSILHTP